MSFEYEQILSRFSIRRFQPASLSLSQFKKLEGYISNVESLNPENDFSCPIFDYDNGDKKAGALGPFGRIFQAPYFLAPHIRGGVESLVDLGFRTQQIVLALWVAGLGSCYIGCAHQQQRTIGLLDLPSGARIISTVAFGTPSEDQSKYFYQRISQAFTRSKKRLDYRDLFLDGSHEKFQEVSETMKKIVEAGRQAPSATNAQPWRFGISGNSFVIYARRKNVGKIYDLDQEYSLHDVGICMANMSQAALALNKPFQWEPFPLSEEVSPDGLIKVARVKITA